MEKEANLSGRITVIEVAFRCIEHHVAEFIPRVALRGDTLTNCNGDIPAV